MIHVIAEIEVAEGMRDAFLAEFRKVIPLVRDEDGCIEYGAAVDCADAVANQPPARANIVTVIEKWTNAAALNEHLSAPHMADYRKRAAGLVLGVRINVLNPA